MRLQRTTFDFGRAMGFSFHFRGADRWVRVQARRGRVKFRDRVRVSLEAKAMRARLSARKRAA